jgi:hypothetical protein
MITEHVPNSFIETISFLTGAEALIVTLTTGAAYLYSEVSYPIFKRFIEAPSKGVFFNAHIRDAFPTVRL